MKATVTIPTGAPAVVVTHPREQLRQLRAKVAEAAQRLIDILDWIDGDPDYEPSLGSVGTSNPHWMPVAVWAQGANDDREQVCEDEGAQCDDEGVDTDSEPDEIADNGECGPAPFAVDQTICQWAYGDTA